jgi:hypothetical protein
MEGAGVERCARPALVALSSAIRSSTTRSSFFHCVRNKRASGEFFFGKADDAKTRKLFFVSSVVAFASRGTGGRGRGGVRAYLGVGRGGGVEHALVDIAGLELRAFRGEASDGVWIGASGFLPARREKRSGAIR